MSSIQTLPNYCDFYISTNKEQDQSIIRILTHLTCDLSVDRHKWVVARKFPQL